MPSAAVGHQQHVRRLDVAVADAVGVDGGHSVGKRPRHPGGGDCIDQPGVRRQPLGQAGCVAEVFRDVDKPIALPDLVHRHQMGMAQPCGQLRLPNEPPPQRRRDEALRPGDLEGDPSPQLPVDRLVDGGEPAPTDLPHHGKPAERGRERGLIRHSLAAIAILSADLVEQEKQIDLGGIDRAGNGLGSVIGRRSPADQTVIEGCQPIGIGAGFIRLREWSGLCHRDGVASTSRDWGNPSADATIPREFVRSPADALPDAAGVWPMPARAVPRSAPPSFLRGCPSIDLEP